MRTRALAGAAVVAVAMAAPTPSRAQARETALEARIGELERQVRALTDLVEKLGRKTAEVDAKAEALAGQQEAAAAGGAQGATAAGSPAATSALPATAGAGTGGTARAAGAAPAPAGIGSYAARAGDADVGRVSLFGYGEINYNRPRRDPSQAQIDIRRAVLGFGYRFSPRLRLTSEFEFEHAVTSADDPGEVAVEQLYLDYAVSEAVNVKAGLFLLPIGLINESHEPTRYFGVERNDVETRVIPSTWREIGVGVHGSLADGLWYDTGITSGFDLHKWDPAEGPSAPLQAIHQEGAVASAASFGAYGAIRYLGIPGLRLGTGVWSGNAAQRNGAFIAGSSAIDLAGLSGRITLWDAHAVWQPGRWDLRALYARGTIGDAGRINDVLASPAVGQTGGFVPRSFDGWYLQAAYDVWRSGDYSLVPFVRYERIDLQRSMPEGYASFVDPRLRDRIVTIGASFFATRNAVIKADYQRYQSDRGRDRFNVGLGYQF